MRWVVVARACRLRWPAAVPPASNGGRTREVAEGRWNEAFASYRAAAERQPDGRVLAKLGGAALRVGNLREAAAAYRAHGARRPIPPGTRRPTAWRLVARAADRAGDTTALRMAIEGLRDVAPEPAGRPVSFSRSRRAERSRRPTGSS